MDRAKDNDRERNKRMKTSDFYYDLPEELIAQTPIEPRDHSRTDISMIYWTICGRATA